MEDEAFLFVAELEELFARWVVEWWQPRHHDGCRLSGVAGLKASPDDLYDESVARWGLTFIPATESLLYELLPVEWRDVHHYGVDVHGLRYDGQALDHMRSVPSPYRGAHPGKWPIRYDPRDLSKMFVLGQDGAWQTIRWVHRASDDEPFSDVVLAHAKHLLRTRGGNRSNRQHLDLVLNDLVARIIGGVQVAAAERRLVRAQRAAAPQLARDYRNDPIQSASVDDLPTLLSPDETMDDLEPMALLDEFEA